MLKSDDKTIVLSDDDNQRLVFFTDGNGDYYFTLYSNCEARSGDYYSFLINKDDDSYDAIKLFIEQEMDYSKEEIVSKTPYFIIKEDSVRIADQNRTVIDAEWVKFTMSPSAIKIVFSEKFPTSIRITGVGRLDFHPFFIPVINLFDNMQLILNKPEESHSFTKKIN